MDCCSRRHRRCARSRRSPRLAAVFKRKSSARARSTLFRRAPAPSSPQRASWLLTRGSCTHSSWFPIRGICPSLRVLLITRMVRDSLALGGRGSCQFIRPAPCISRLLRAGACRHLRTSPPRATWCPCRCGCLLLLIEASDVHFYPVASGSSRGSQPSPTAVHPLGLDVAFRGVATAVAISTCSRFGPGVVVTNGGAPAPYKQTMKRPGEPPWYDIAPDTPKWHERFWWLTPEEIKDIEEETEWLTKQWERMECEARFAAAEPNPQDPSSRPTTAPVTTAATAASSSNAPLTEKDLEAMIE